MDTAFRALRREGQARLERALRAGEERVACLSTSGVLGIFELDAGGHVLDANDAFLAMVGHTRAELDAGEVRLDALTPSDWVRAPLEEGGMRDVMRPVVREFARKDGTRTSLLIGATVLSHPRCVAFAADLSERQRSEAAVKRVEHRLLERQKLESISVLAAGLAHDFNNLLSVILSNTIFVLERLGEEHHEARAELESVRIAAERAGNLTTQLLAFTRQQTVQPRLLDLNEVLRGMDKVVRPLMGPDIQTTLHLEVGLGCVFADPTALEQIILSLARNARDAMPDGGSFAIETAGVVLDERFAAQQPNLVPGPYVMLRMTDTGVGMDAATQARAFEPFFTTKKGRGAGLGLSTVLGLVQQGRGSIWIKSETGKGTAVTVCLPQREGEPAEPASMTRPSAGMCGGTILVVEEDDSVREVICGILRRAGYAVLDAGNGGEALLLCEENAGKIDLLLSELLLQRLSGVKLANRMRSLCPGMRVLFMSRYVAPPGEDAEREGEAAAVLLKPITPAALMTRVREVLGGPA